MAAVGGIAATLCRAASSSTSTTCNHPTVPLSITVWGGGGGDGSGVVGEGGGCYGGKCVRWPCLVHLHCDGVDVASHVFLVEQGGKKGRWRLEWV